MMKEINHRFGFYLVSVLVVTLLVFLYLDVRSLSRDVNTLLIANSEAGLDPMFLAQQKELERLRLENQALRNGELFIEVEEDEAIEL